MDDVPLVEVEDTPTDLIAAYLAQRPVLVRLFTARLRSAAAAEDLVQEIYFRIVDKDQAAPVSNAAGLLYRIGWNLMLDSRRGERRTAQREANWVASATTRVGAETVVEEASPEAAIDARQKLTRIVEALDGLPPPVQRTFRMHKFDGLTHAQCAAALGISRSLVEKHVSAALKHLLKATRS